MYLINGTLSNSLPFRLHLPDGRTRTSLHEMSEAELAELKDQANSLKAKWENEKAAVEKIRILKEEMEQVKADKTMRLSGADVFKLNDTFGFYVKANNLLAQKYELYYGYPMQRLSAQVGVNINF